MSNPSVNLLTNSPTELKFGTLVPGHLSITITFFQKNWSHGSIVINDFVKFFDKKWTFSNLNPLDPIGPIFLKLGYVLGHTFKGSTKNFHKNWSRRSILMGLQTWAKVGKNGDFGHCVMKENCNCSGPMGRIVMKFGTTSGKWSLHMRLKSGENPSHRSKDIHVWMEILWEFEKFQGNKLNFTGFDFS
jgi:hypothetical protein